MTEMALSAAIGYGLGQLSPAALISKIKDKDLRENGTGNLGATNTLLVFGKVYGIGVMIFDVLKAFFAVKIAKILFPKLALAGLILAYDVRVLLGLLFVAILIMVITDTGHYGPTSAMVLFPVWLWIKVKSPVVFGGVAAVGGLIIYKHRENFAKAKEGREIRVREFAEKCEEFQSEEDCGVEDQFLEKQ